eukprot:Tbor_TRINITY_DN5392_c0_g2::TRINITY_DN5392_c0_g2_i1::g.4003::m.4003
MSSNGHVGLADNESMILDTNDSPKSSCLPNGRGNRCSMFDCSEMGRDLRQRWKSPKYRDIVAKYLMKLSNTTVTVSQKSDNGKYSSEAGDQQKPDQISELQKLVVSEVENLKRDIPEKPWHDIIKFVSFDLPINNTQILHWIDSLIEEAKVDNNESKSKQSPNDSELPAAVCENREAARKHILSTFSDNMRDHENIQEYMNDIILPFRRFFMSSVIYSVLKNLDQSSDLQSSLSSDETLPSITPPKGIFNEARVYPRHIHAAQHAKDLAAVLFIESMIPHKVDMLYRYVLDDLLSGDASLLILGEMDVVSEKDSDGTITSMLKRKNTESIQSRVFNIAIPNISNYAQYHLIYLDRGSDWDDVTFIKAMLHIAHEGLAFAQYDIGVCFIILNEVDVGMEWLEKAANCGHSKAMVHLARQHLTIFFDADKIINSADETKLGINTGSIKGYTALKTNEEKRYALMKYHLKRCQEWLEKLSESNWDNETLTNDIPEGNLLKAVIEKNAIPLLYKCSSVVKKTNIRDKSFFFEIVAIVCTVVVVAFFFFSLSVLRSMNGSKSLFVW